MQLAHLVRCARDANEDSRRSRHEALDLTHLYLERRYPTARIFKERDHYIFAAVEGARRQDRDMCGNVCKVGMQLTAKVFNHLAQRAPDIRDKSV